MKVDGGIVGQKVRLFPKRQRPLAGLVRESRHYNIMVAL
jgi:hypothetical protein